MDKVKIYSPNQMICGAFLGGPIGAVFLLYKNFAALGNKSAAKRTVIWGIAFNALLLVSIPFLPKNFPNEIIPIAYTCAAEQIARHRQMTKRAILDSSQYEFQSNWRVLGVSMGFLVAYCVLILLWVLALQTLFPHLDL